MLDDALTESDAPDRLAVPAAVEPFAVEPVMPLAAAPVVAVLADDVAVVDADADDPGVVVEFDVVLSVVAVAPSFAGAVALPLELAVVVLPDVFAVVPGMFVDVVVWAWSAVVPSSAIAKTRETAGVGCGVPAKPKRMS